MMGKWNDLLSYLRKSIFNEFFVMVQFFDCCKVNIYIKVVDGINVNNA